MSHVIEIARLIQNGGSSNRRVRRLCLHAIDNALEAINPSTSLKARLKVKRGKLIVDHLTFPLPNVIKVLSVGKASIPMMQTMLSLLKDRDVSGILVAPKNEKIEWTDTRLEVFHSGHPFPDEDGVRAAEAVISTAGQMRKGDLLICLISGGASAMLPAPPETIPLSDKRNVTEQLIKSRATIHEINTVRRHLSRLKGGRLVELCGASTVLSFIISDVSGNILSDIASGPTAPDPTTFRDAVNVLQRYGLWDGIPAPVKAYLQGGLIGNVTETPKPGDPRFRRVHNFIIADNRSACNAAKAALEKKRAHATILASSVDMEAQSMGNLLASVAHDDERFSHPLQTSAAIILGGETTVQVRGNGVGGRNQETAMSAIERIAGLKGVAIAAIGTDGIDGNSPAAGAIIDGNSASRADQLGLNLREFMERNDSYNLFHALHDNIVTGRTGTNVGDLYILVRSK